MKFNLNACIDVTFVKTLGKAIADAVLPGIGNIKENLAKAKEYFKNIGTVVLQSFFLFSLRDTHLRKLFNLTSFVKE